MFSEESAGNAGQESQVEDPTKCKKPTITYNNGKITFSCGTDGVEFVSEITSKDVKQYNDSRIFLSNIFQISVYAKKAGLENSETVTMEIIGSGGILGDLNKDGVVNVADHVELTKIIMGESQE